MKVSLLFVFLTIVFWGLWGFLNKLAIGKVGIQISLWNALSVLLVVILYLIVTNQVNPIKNDASGILLALLAGASSGFGSVLFYTLLGKTPAGLLVAFTALYPLITILLSVILLKEPLATTKVIGFILALSALVLLSL